MILTTRGQKDSKTNLQKHSPDVELELCFWSIFNLILALIWSLPTPKKISECFDWPPAPFSSLTTQLQSFAPKVNQKCLYNTGLTPIQCLILTLFVYRNIFWRSTYRGVKSTWPSAFFCHWYLHFNFSKNSS